MSNFNLSKKLQPAKKAWKSFISHLRSKLRHTKFAGAITTFRRRCTAAWRSISPFIHRKFLTPPQPRRRHFHRRKTAVQLDELFPKPEVLLPRKTKENMDEARNIIGLPGFNASTDDNKSTGGKIQIQHVDKVNVEISVKDEKGSKAAAWKGKAKAGESSRSTSDPAFNNNNNKWKIPEIRGVDERAEEFIAKFRLDMKLEREQSIVEFQEMLKRSA